VPGAAIVVLAKAPVPGAVKTRLCPPLAAEQAAALAEAALADTLAAVTRTAARARVLALDGAPGPWLPDGVRVVEQRGAGLGERIAAALADAGEPALALGMDTPQLEPALLAAALEALTQPVVDAVLGRAADGGYWAVGLRAPVPAAFDGVPMSSPRTCAAQRDRFRALGLRVFELPQLRDVDTLDDARAVARQAPATRFAATLREVLDETDAGAPIPPAGAPSARGRR
jgi:uncharacterized protein